MHINFFMKSQSTPKKENFFRSRQTNSQMSRISTLNLLRSLSVLESSSMKFIILFSCLLLLLDLQAHADDPILRECDNSENYTANSQFQTNLNLLLRSLRSNGARDGFFNASTGSAPDTVYGLVQCRGDASREQCQTCLNNITVDITQICPAKKDIAVRYSDCILRYSNQRFFSQVKNNWVAAYNTANIPDADIALFNQLLGRLMKNLSSVAASRPDRYKFGETEFTSFRTIYGMVQCNRDLSPAGCQNCLQSMISAIPTCCNSKQGARIFSATCDIRFEIYPFIENQPVSPPPPPPTATTSPPETTNNANNTEEGNGIGKGESTKVVAIVLPIIASVVLLFGICVLFITRRARKNKRKEKQEIISEKEDIGREDSLQFDLDIIRTATNGFADANKVGEGGFGAVYMGELLDGQKIAVKRLSKNSTQGLQEFKNEVLLLAKLQHRNLVRLLGFCLEGDEKILIYEFVPNASLDKFLFDSVKCTLLDWETRHKIIGGIARGLLYLHEDSRDRIIHRDLKVSNILLDIQMNPKIADFGMAKLFTVDQTQACTSRVVGTYGYMAPEYAMRGQFSVKSDVFSFGVLVLEIISGKRNNFSFSSQGAANLLSHAWRQWQDRTPLELLDPTIRENYSESEVMRCIHIALLCVQEDGAKRPTMASVVLMLDSYSVRLALPSYPAFFYNSADSNMEMVLEVTPRNATNLVKWIVQEQNNTCSTQHSINNVTITELEPR